MNKYPETLDEMLAQHAEADKLRRNVQGKRGEINYYPTPAQVEKYAKAPEKRYVYGPKSLRTG